MFFIEQGYILGKEKRKMFYLEVIVSLYFWIKYREEEKGFKKNMWD